MTSWRSVSCRTVAAACTCAPPSLSLSLSLSLPLRVLLQMRRETDDGSKSAAVKSHSHGAWRAVVVVGGLQNVMAGIVESGVPESRVVLAGLGLGGTCAVHTATKHAHYALLDLTMRSSVTNEGFASSEQAHPPSLGPRGQPDVGCFAPGSMS
jgi:hypothetical protein